MNADVFNVIRRLPAGLMLVCLAATAEASAITALVTDSKGAPLSDAVIYALPVTTTGITKPLRPAIINQVDKEFTPLVTPVQTGTLINFPNKDNIRHQIYSFSPPKIFNLKLYSGVPADPVLFDKPGVVVLGCNIHDWMLAYVYVVDTPYFAKTKDGRGRIDALPAGSYQLRIWHPNLVGTLPEQVVKIGAIDEAPVKFQLELQAKSPQAPSQVK